MITRCEPSLQITSTHKEEGNQITKLGIMYQGYHGIKSRVYFLSGVFTGLDLLIQRISTATHPLSYQTFC